MKKIKLLLIATLLVVSASIEAQVTASFNFGTPPVWAPKNAEPAKFYYLPEIETYYDVPSRRYIYMRNGSWYKSAALPAQYRNYNLAKGQTVYITNYRGNYPYYYFKQHKAKYYKGNNSAHKYSNGNGNFKPNNSSKGNGNGNFNETNSSKGNGKNKGNGNGNGKSKGNGNKQGKGKN